MITPEDRLALSRPKKAFFAFLSVWTVCAMGIYYVKHNKPEMFYRKVLINPLVMPSMIIFPTVGSYYYMTE